MQNSWSSNFVPRRQKVGVVTVVFTSVAGLIVMLSGILWINKFSVDSSWTKVQGTIVDTVLRTYPSSRAKTATFDAPVIHYVVNGTTYSVEGNVDVDPASKSIPAMSSAEYVAYPGGIFKRSLLC